MEDVSVAVAALSHLPTCAVLTPRLEPLPAHTRRTATVREMRGRPVSKGKRIHGRESKHAAAWAGEHSSGVVFGFLHRVNRERRPLSFPRVNGPGPPKRVEGARFVRVSSPSDGFDPVDGRERQLQHLGPADSAPCALCQRLLSLHSQMAIINLK
jgi:hypothetical protein